MGRMKLLLLATLVNIAAGTVAWEEAVDGSLSTDRLNPTALTMSCGHNSVMGTIVSGISKFITFTPPANSGWMQLYLDDWVSTDDLGFLGLVADSTFTVDPAAPNVGDLIGYYHFGEPDIGNGDFLSALGQGPGSQGFTPPLLPPQAFSMWLRQGIDPDFLPASPPPPHTHTRNGRLRARVRIAPSPRGYMVAAPTCSPVRAVLWQAVRISLRMSWCS